MYRSMSNALFYAATILADNEVVLVDLAISLLLQASQKLPLLVRGLIGGYELSGSRQAQRSFGEGPRTLLSLRTPFFHARTGGMLVRCFNSCAQLYATSNRACEAQTRTGPASNLYDPRLHPCALCHPYSLELETGLHG